MPIEGILEEDEEGNKVIVLKESKKSMTKSPFDCGLWGWNKALIDPSTTTQRANGPMRDQGARNKFQQFLLPSSLLLLYENLISLL